MPTKTKTKPQYIVEISYPNGGSGLGLITKTDDQAHEIAKAHKAKHDGGGSGFGQRDLEYIINGYNEARKLRTAFHKAGFTTDQEPRRLDGGE